jgi:thiosulfate/3-mercaptopyruvate sulfurtransferase
LHALPRRDLVAADQLAAVLGLRGIAPEQTIVLCGGNSWFAAYAYWLFQLRGAERVRLLDGGRQRWGLESRPLETEQPDRPPARFRLGRPARSYASFATRCSPGRAT